MNFNYVIVRVVVLIASLSLLACSQEQPNNQPQEQKTKLAAPADTTENRREMALKVIRAYPSPRWGNDILARIQSQVGKEVTAQFQTTIERRMGEKEIEDVRLKLLTESFSAAQLEKLAELYQDPQTMAVLQRMPQFEDKIRNSVQPILMEILSGAGNK